MSGDFSVLAEQLEHLKQQQLYRSHRALQSPQGVKVWIDGRELLNFSSNDYLGMASNTELKRVWKQALEKYGCGSGASHLVCGHFVPHQVLEQELAEWLGRERALVFSTGYMANLGVITALLGRGDEVMQDRLNHASLLDGGLLSGARLKRYRHGDYAHLQAQLSASTSRRLIVTDGVFSMDGDLADLPTLAALQNDRTWLMVDDAHGLGVLGANGGGIVEYFGLDQTQLPVLVGTFGKALGTFGAFVAGSEVLIETLINKARSYIYTTALPPAWAEATLESVRQVKKDAAGREKLKALIARFRQGAFELGLNLSSSLTPIQPLLIGDAETALALSQNLYEAGVWVPAIRPPTVPVGTARLRIALSAAHTEKDVDYLLTLLDRFRSLNH